MVLVGVELVRPTDLRLHRHDARADELDHPPAVAADQMVVPLAGVDVLVEVAIASQPVASHQPAGDQQIEVAVNGGARDLDAPLPHRLQELLRVQVPVACEDFLEQGSALGGHPVSVPTEIVEELAPFVIECHLRGSKQLRRRLKYVLQILYCIGSDCQSKHVTAKRRRSPYAALCAAASSRRAPCGRRMGPYFD